MQEIKPEEYFWIDGRGQKILMKDMSPDHLQRAHTHICAKEFDTFNKVNFFNQLRDKLEETAKIRRIKLKDPDELHPDNPNYRNYFCARRRTRVLAPMPVLSKELVIHNERSLEQTKEVGVTQPQYHDEESE